MSFTRKAGWAPAGEAARHTNRPTERNRRLVIRKASAKGGTRRTGSLRMDVTSGGDSFQSPLLEVAVHVHDHVDLATASERGAGVDAAAADLDDGVVGAVDPGREVDGAG